MFSDLAGAFQCISIHVLREESDWSDHLVALAYSRFQSTFSVRRATHDFVGVTVGVAFQSTFSVRRATRGQELHRHGKDEISIHVLREESDRGFGHAAIRDEISIHVLREESDGSANRGLACWRHFNPRSP